MAAALNDVELLADIFSEREDYWPLDCKVWFDLLFRDIYRAGVRFIGLQCMVLYQ